MSLHYYVRPHQPLIGTIQIPGDKSISHRSLMLAAIAEGRSDISGFLMGADNLATLHALQNLGINIRYSENENEVTVEGVGLYGLKPPAQILDLGNSGTAIRLLTGLLAGQTFTSTLTGDDSLLTRPMRRVVDPLLQMGADIDLTAKGTAPLTVKPAKLHGIDYSLPIPSAQVKSCIILAAIYANTATTILESIPTRDHTERMLKKMNYPITCEGNQIRIEPKGQLRGTQLIIPGDISSAAFFLVGASITPGSEILLQKVGMNKRRTGVVEILKAMGADIEILNLTEEKAEPFADFRVRHASLQGINIPAEYIVSAIDEFPAIFIAAACAEGVTVLRGAEELRVKETDRLAVMAEGLQKLGVSVKLWPDGIEIHGTKTINGAEIDSHGDHRIAMAFTMLGCVAKQPIRILNCDNVATSFPNFVELARALGVLIEVGK